MLRSSRCRSACSARVARRFGVEHLLDHPHPGSGTHRGVHRPAGSARTPRRSSRAGCSRGRRRHHRRARSRRSRRPRRRTGRTGRPQPSGAPPRRQRPAGRRRPRAGRGGLVSSPSSSAPLPPPTSTTSPTSVKSHASSTAAAWLVPRRAMAALKTASCSGAPLRASHSGAPLTSANTPPAGADGVGQRAAQVEDVGRPRSCIRTRLGQPARVVAAQQRHHAWLRDQRPSPSCTIRSASEIARHESEQRSPGPRRRGRRAWPRRTAHPSRPAARGPTQPAGTASPRLPGPAA